MKLSYFIAVMVLVCGVNQANASVYTCKPSYTYHGWMKERTITLNSTYYLGYGATEEAAQNEARFLCNNVYKHCTTDAAHCRTSQQTVVQCWSKNHLVSGTHHDRNAAAWIAKNRCQTDHALQVTHNTSCSVQGCHALHRNDLG